MISTAARRAVLTCTRRSIASSSRGIASICINHQSLNRKTQDTTSTHSKSQIIVSSSPTVSTQRRLSSNLPYHIVVGMPALSPTMESGTISKWNVGNGDSFSAGDSLAVIETDKATIDFEAQDDGVVAKILVPAGSGELNVGSPIMVTVDDAADVAAFENFSPEAGGGAPAAVAAPATEPAAAAPAAAAPAKDLPYHLVVGMPALSPTMDAGTISKWNVSEGDSFAAGDSIAVIETDKASMDFEAQDDGVVAKLLVQPGSGEISVGVPIMVTVEDGADVAAFKDFVAGTAPSSSATEASAPAPVVEEKIAAPVSAPAVAAAAPTPTPAAAPVAAATPAPAVSGEAISIGGSPWGKLAAQKSPLAKALAAKQQQYIEKYGSTGHIPIV
ncbi:hypothetical protein ACHAWO_007656 [Cyclotella atomus]|uniref:Lipoyl-binding domain-containing protein n=1 Tax=Cyclotella atomus TaxID=382360 RepID=A0ABD3Q488_9STRA